jgi:hypothetical protein
VVFVLAKAILFRQRRTAWLFQKPNIPLVRSTKFLWFRMRLIRGMQAFCKEPSKVSDARTLTAQLSNIEGTLKGFYTLEPSGHMTPYLKSGQK